MESRDEELKPQGAQVVRLSSEGREVASTAADVELGFPRPALRRSRQALKTILIWDCAKALLAFGHLASASGRCPAVVDATSQKHRERTRFYRGGKGTPCRKASHVWNTSPKQFPPRPTGHLGYSFGRQRELPVALGQSASPNARLQRNVDFGPLPREGKKRTVAALFEDGTSVNSRAGAI